MTNVNHAIVLADTYAPFLDPIVRDTPALLLKIGGVYLLDVLIHRLCTTGITSIIIVTNSHANALQEYIDKDCYWSPTVRRISTQAISEPRDAVLSACPSTIIAEPVSIQVVRASSRNLYSCLRDVYKALQKSIRSYNSHQGEPVPQFLLVDGPAITNLNFVKPIEYHNMLKNLHSRDGTDYILTAILSIHTETSALRPLVAPSIIIRDIETCELKSLIVDATTSSAIIDLELPFEDKCHMQISSNLYLTGFYVTSLSFFRFFTDNDSFKDTESMHTFLSSLLDTRANYSVKMGSYLLESCEAAVTVDSPRLYQEINRAYIKGYFRPYSPETNLIHYKGLKTQFRSVSDWMTMGAMQLQSCGTLYCDETTRIPPNMLIAGDSLVHRNCELGEHLHLSSSMLCDGVSVGCKSNVIDTIINSGTRIGNRCVLRSCYIGPGVHIEDDIALPCGSMVGKSVVVNPEVLYQSIKMTFQAYFHCNFDAYLSFISRYYLYMDDQMENVLENAGFAVGSPLPRFTVAELGSAKISKKILSPDQIEKLKLLQKYKDVICSFFRNEVPSLPSDIIVRFIPPIFLTVTRPPLSVLHEYKANSMATRRLTTAPTNVSPEFKYIGHRKVSITTTSEQNSDSLSPNTTPYSLPSLFPPKQPPVNHFAALDVSNVSEQTNVLTDIVLGSASITDLPWPGITQTTLNPLSNANKYDEFFMYLVECANDETQNCNDNNDSLIVVLNERAEGDPPNIMEFNVAESSDGDESSDSISRLSDDIIPQQQQQQQSEKDELVSVNQISPKVINELYNGSANVSQSRPEGESSDFSAGQIMCRSESRSSKSRVDGYCTEKTSLYTLPYYIIRSLNDFEQPGDTSTSMRASFVGEIRLARLPEEYSSRLTTSLKYLLFSGFIFRATFYAFFDLREMSYMTLKGMDSLPASMCRPLPYIKHIASAKSIEKKYLATFDVDENILSACEKEDYAADTVGEEARKQRSLAQFKETVRDLLLETLGAVLATNKVHHYKSKSLDPALKGIDSHELCRQDLSTTLSSIHLRTSASSKGMDTCPDFYIELKAKLVTDFHTAVKNAEECKLNTNNQRALSILAQFVYLYIFLGPTLFSRLDPWENNHIPSGYCIEGKYTVTIPEKESCPARIYLSSSGSGPQNEVADEVLHIPPLASILEVFSHVVGFFFHDGFKNSVFSSSDCESEEDEGEEEEEFALTFVEFIVTFFKEFICEEEIFTMLVEAFMILYRIRCVSRQTLLSCKRILSTSDDKIEMMLHTHIFTKIQEYLAECGSVEGPQSISGGADASARVSESDEYEYYYVEDEMEGEA